MINLAQQGYTHAQVIELLTRREGIDRAEYPVEILRDGVVVGTITQKDPLAGIHSGYSECTLECSSESEVKYTGAITLTADPRIHWNTDLLRPVMLWPVPGATLRFPFVPLVPVTPVSVMENGMELFEVELYDESVYLQGNSLANTVFYAAGTPYLAIVKQLFTESGFDKLNILHTDKALQTDRTFDAGQERLALGNLLLEEINYRSAEIGMDGILTSYPYEPPSAANASIRYAAGRHGLVEPKKRVERDSYKKHNRFIGFVSNPDLPEPLRFEYTNTSPTSPTSTVNQRGRIITAPPRQYDNVADAETLGGLVLKWASEVAMSWQTISLNTAIMPHHGASEAVAVNTGGINGIFQEVAWSINFAARTMSHTLRGELYE